MARFYGDVQGNKGAGSRVGTDEFRASAQSRDGSIVVKLRYEGDELMVEIGTMEWSSSDFHHPNWWGTFRELDELLRKDTCRKHG